MSEFRKVAKGAIWIFSVSILTAALGYLSKVILARILGPAEYGLFVLSITIAYIFSSFAQSGIAPALSYFIPKYRKSKKLPNILSTLFWILSIFILIISCLFLAFSNQIAIAFGESKIVPYLPYILLFLIAYTFVTLFRNIFRSYEDAKTPSLFSLSRAIAFLVIGSSLTYFYRSSLTPLLVYIFIYFTLLFLMYLQIRKFLRFGKPKKNYIPEILYFSFSMFFVGITTLILRWTDVWMISWFMSSDYVGIYNAATSTAYLLNFFISAFMFLYFPIATKLISSNKRKEVRDLATKVVFWNSIIIAPIFFLMLALSKDIIGILFGEKFILAAVPLSILSIGLFFRNVISVNGTNLLASGRKKEILISSIFAAGINVALNYILIPIYGIAGAAVATTTSIIFNFSLRWLFAHKYKLSPNYYFVIKPLAIAFLLFIPLYVLTHIFSFQFVYSILFASIYLVAYTITINFFVIKIKKMITQVTSMVK